jgi:hypothetical protein
MKLPPILALAVLGCSSSSPSKKDPVTPPSGDQCAAQTTELGKWLSALAAEGSRMIATQRGVTLVHLDEVARPVPRGAVITISPDEVAFQGQLVLVTKGAGADLAKWQPLFERLDAVKPRDKMLIVADSAVPWAAVSQAALSATSAGHSVVFVFTAKSEVSKPPPSAIDAQLAEIAKPTESGSKAARLGEDSNKLPDIFKDCPSAKSMLKKLGESDADRDKGIVEDLPKAIAACDCKVEISSVQHLMWAWWGRDDGDPNLGVAVEITKARQ